eukprot:232639_1
MAQFLLWVPIFNTLLVESYTRFQQNYTSNACNVQECQECCYTQCTDWTDITTASAETYIASGSCFDKVTCDVSQWIWPSGYHGTGYTRCSCPLCSCSVLDEVQYIKVETTSQASCYAFKCNILSPYYYGDGSGGTLLGLESQGGWVANMYSWDGDLSTFQCPPATCTDNGAIYYEDDTWWNEATPTSFCICQSDSTALCSQDYAGILSNSILNAAFQDECGDDLRGSCATDTSTWFDAGSYDGCPRCECSGVGFFTAADQFGDGNECYECACTFYSVANKSGYDCGYSPVYELSASALEGKAWVCPPISCDYDGLTYWEGDSWFDSSDTACQTFCVCPSTGTAICSTQYAGIPADTALAAAFADKCEYYMENSCLTQADRWVAGSSCGCPSCGCPVDLSDPLDTWFGGWVDEDAVASASSSTGSFVLDFGGSSDPYHCDLCHCENDETSCETAVSADWDISSHCSDAAITQCYQGDAPSNAADITSAIDTIELGYCEPYKDYCGISHSGSDFSASSNTQYDCSEGFVCEVLGLTDGGCAIAQYTSPMYYLDYASDGIHCELKAFPSYPQVEYTSCCSGDACNNYQLDPSACVENAVYTEYAQQVFECAEGSPAYWRSFGVFMYAFLAAFGGDVCEVDVSREPCDMVRDFFESYILCPCGATSTLYNSAHATTEEKADMAAYFEAESTGPDDMNVDSGCGLSFTCDLATGVATLTDIDYTLAFDLEVDCYVLTCSDASAYLFDVYDAGNITVVLASIVTSSCSVSSNTLVTHVAIAFGGSKVKDEVLYAMQNDVLNWGTPGCSAIVTNDVTTESSTIETYGGPTTPSPTAPTPPPTTAAPTTTTAKPTTADPTTADPTTADPTTAKPTSETSLPTTSEPTVATSEPTVATSNPTTSQPTAETSNPTTSEPTTSEPTPSTTVDSDSDEPIVGGSDACAYNICVGVLVALALHFFFV